MLIDSLLLAATQIYLSLAKPQDSPAERATLRWRAADEAFALNEHLLMMERDNPTPATIPVVAVTTYDTVKVKFLANCLHQAKGNVTEAARIAGIKRTTFWAAAKRVGLTAPRKRRTNKKVMTV